MNDVRDRDEARDRDPRERDVDPRDVFIDCLALPRGLDREIVMEGHTDARGHSYKAARGGAVSTNRCLCRLKAFFNWTLDLAELREYLQQGPQKGPQADRIIRRREAGKTVTPPRVNRLGA